MASLLIDALGKASSEEVSVISSVALLAASDPEVWISSLAKVLEVVSLLIDALGKASSGEVSVISSVALLASSTPEVSISSKVEVVFCAAKASDVL